MWKFLKDIFNSLKMDSGPDSGDSIHKLATANALNRRKNARINYPHLGPSGPFPRVTMNQIEINVSNVSVGGILAVDDTGVFGQNVGEVYTFEFIWPDLKTRQRARLVGANLQKRHFQFVDFNAQAFVRISQLVKPGFMGQKFRLVEDDTGALNAIEMWMGPGNETLVFFDSEILAEFSRGSEKIVFPANQSPRREKPNELLSPLELQDLFVMLGNIGPATPRVKRLVESVDRWLRTSSRPARTGTDG